MFIFQMLEKKRENEKGQIIANKISFKLNYIFSYNKTKQYKY